MGKEYVEFFKMLSPFIILAISVILIPWIKRIYSSYISFFSLPTSRKIEALEYVNGYKKSSNTLKKIKHKIIMSDYKLHEDTELSKCIISFYYEDLSDNGYFSKSLLRIKGMYIFEKNRIYVNVKNVLFALAFWLFTFLTYYLSYDFSTDSNSGLPNAVFSISLIAAAVFYTCIMMIVSTRFISILKNKKRFNRYLSSKL
ncbi:TPA: hypothetical protein ACOEEM_004379 [Enterobacter asburiae]